jgi:hypothetical protein
MKAFEQQKEKIYWIKIKDGQFVYWNGKTEELYSEFTGVLTDVFFKQDEYQGKQFDESLFTFIYKGEKYILSMRCDTSYFRQFCNLIRNSIIGVEILVKPRMVTINGKKKGSIFIKQNDTWLKGFYTKEKPGDLPQAEIIEVGNQKIYNNFLQIEFWKAYLKDILQQSTQLDDPNDDMPF